MTFAGWLITVLSVVSSSVSAQSPRPDPISGEWGQQDTPMLALKFDGKSAVSGTTFWRAGAKNAEAAIKKGTFDPKTGAATSRSGSSPRANRPDACCSPTI